MKKITFFASLFLLFPGTALAHGGFEKRAESVVVEILQDPLSPLMEKM